MKYIKQFTILVTACFIGEILHRIIPLPIPASIYGLVLMFLALEFKIMPLSVVEETSDYLLEIMPLLFVPSTVGLIVAWPIIKKYALAFILVGVLGTTFTFFVTGRLTQFVIRLSKKKNSSSKTDKENSISQNNNSGAQ